MTVRVNLVEAAEGYFRGVRRNAEGEVEAGGQALLQTGLHGLNGPQSHQLDATPLAHRTNGIVPLQPRHVEGHTAAVEHQQPGEAFGHAVPLSVVGKPAQLQFVSKQTPSVLLIHPPQVLLRQYFGRVYPELGFHPGGQKNTDFPHIRRLIRAVQRDLEADAAGRGAVVGVRAHIQRQ